MTTVTMGPAVMSYDADPVLAPGRKPPDKEQCKHRKKRKLRKLLSQLKRQHKESSEIVVEVLQNIHVRRARKALKKQRKDLASDKLAEVMTLASAE